MTSKINYMELPDTIAIVGSRSFIKNLTAKTTINKHIHTFVSKLNKGTTIISGGARGVDQWAARNARKVELDVVEYYPDQDKPYVLACFARNKTIVDHIKENDGLVVAFVDENSWRGTSDTVSYALRQGVPVRLFVFNARGEYKGEPDNIEEYTKKYRAKRLTT